MGILATCGVGALVFVVGTETRAAERAATNVTELGEVVVSASRREMPLRDTPDIVQVIERGAIDAVKPQSTGELLEYATGVAVETGTGAGHPDRSVVSLNGLPAYYTLVLVDGVPLLSEHAHTGQNIDMIPPDSIERIEIMRGAASAQYGSSPIGGVVNIVTRKCAGEPEGNLRAAYGSYDTREGSATFLLPAGGRVRVSSMLNWEDSEGQPLKAPASRVDKTGYDRLNLLNRVDAELGDDTSLFAWVNWVDSSMEWQQGWADSTLVTPVLGMTRQFTRDLDAFAQASYSEWDAEVNGELERLLKPEANIRWQLAEGHTLMGGADFAWNEFERTSVASHEQTAFGGFLQDEWNGGGMLTLLAALRYDSVEAVDDAVSPKLSLMVKPADPVRLRASVARGFRAPRLIELYEEGYGHSGRAYRFGNPDLDPEYSTTYTAGIELQPVRPLQLILQGYYSDLEDMIVPVYMGPWEQDPSVDVWRRTNIDKAEVYGGEAGLKLRMGRYAVLEGGYTITDNEDKDTGHGLPYQPGSSLYGRLTASQALSAKVRLSEFVGARAAYDREAWNWKPAAGTAPDNPNGLTTALEDYTNLDAGFSLAIDTLYEVFAKVSNILGEDIENLDDAFTVLDGEPTLMVGVQYNLPFRRR